jgi:mitochondrial fission protein ELM1
LIVSDALPTHQQNDAWVVSVQRKAHVNQCLALSNAAGLNVSKTIEIPGTTATDKKLLKIVDVVKSIMRCLTLFVTLPVPHGKVVLCSGRSISLLVWFWKKWAPRSFYSIYVGHAKSPLVFYDMMLIPEHDVPLMMQRRVPPHSVKIVKTTGILTTQKTGNHEKHADSVLVCVGGDNITFSYDGIAFRNFLSTLEQVNKSHSLKIAVSGRTTAKIRQLIEEKQGLRTQIIEAHDRAGFVQTQRHSASIFVCPDSITMISEALATGAKVYVPRLEELNRKTSDFLFLAECRNKGYVCEVEDFPTASTPNRFPDSLVQSVPSVLSGISRWRSGIV